LYLYLTSQTYNNFFWKFEDYRCLLFLPNKSSALNLTRVNAAIWREKLAADLFLLNTHYLIIFLREIFNLKKWWLSQNRKKYLIHNRKKCNFIAALMWPQKLQENSHFLQIKYLLLFHQNSLAYPEFICGVNAPLKESHRSHNLWLEKPK